MKSKCVLAVIMALSFGPAFASAETKTYDIRDLLIAIPDYDDVGKAAPQKPAVSKQELVDTVVDAVRGAMPKASAASANIRELEGQLIITTDAAGHAAIGDVLKQARESRSVQVMVTTTVLRVTDAALKDLDDDLRARVFAATIDPKRSSVELSLADTSALRLAAGGEQVLAPRLTTFSGQKASIEVQPQEKFVAHLRVDCRALTDATGRSLSLSFGVTHGSPKDASADIEAEYAGPVTRHRLFVAKSDAATRAGGRRLLAIVEATPIVQREIDAPGK